MAIRFLYFDLGQVLAKFDLQVLFRNIGAVTGLDEDAIRDGLFASGLQAEFERGEVEPQEFFDRFRAATGASCSFEEIERAATEFFEINTDVLPVVTSLCLTNTPRGILSNTCVTHWRHCCERFSIVRECFPVHALSFEIGVMKPDAGIYEAAAKLAGCSPEEIFFVDDMQKNVDAACEFGFDAVLFTSGHQLAADLRARGVELNV